MKLLKKSVYDKLVTKVNNVDPSELLLKTKYNTDKSDLKKKTSDAYKKVSDTSGLVKKQIIMLKLRKKRVGYLVLVVQVLNLHQLQWKIK